MLLLIVILLEPLVFMVGWNKIVHPIFEITVINYLQAFGLFTLLSLPMANKTTFIANSERGLLYFKRIINPQGTYEDEDRDQVKDLDNLYLRSKILYLLLFTGLIYIFF